MGVRTEIGSIAPLDGLRGIAVLWVILFHYCALREPAGDPWVEALRRVPMLEAVVRNGYLGVDLFFLLSGFLLVLPWLVRARAGDPPPAAMPFYRRRFLRIAPAYYVQLVLMFVVAVPLLRGLDYWRRDFFVMVWNVAAHAGFVHNTNPLTSGSLAVNGALWTLAVEAQFYLLLPLVAPLFARAPATSTALAFIAASAWQSAARHGFEPLVAGYVALGAHWAWPESVIRNLLVTQLPSYLGHFALGALLARAWLSWRDGTPTAARRGALVAMGILGALLLVGVLASRRAVWGEHTWLLTTAALGALLFAAATGSGWIARTLLSRGPLAFTGRISYSAYLYHLPVLLLGMRLTNGASPALLPAYLAIVAGVAWLSWRCVEQRYYGERASARARAHGEREEDRHGLQ